MSLADIARTCLRQQLESLRAHEAAVDALLAVSRHARTGHGLADFYRRLTRSIAELVAAEKVVFWQLDDGGMLQPIAGAHGVDNEFMAGLRPAPCSPDSDDVAPIAQCIAGHGKFEELPKMDHFFFDHDSMAASFQSRGPKQFDSRSVDIVVEWLQHNSR